MSKEDYTADFTLSSKTTYNDNLLDVVFSSAVVEVMKLEDSRNAVLSGKWTEKTAGGCHLYDKEYEQKSDKYTWVNNPKFHIRMQTQDPTQIKVTLSRPEKAWKKHIGMNLVGCMIGFYVYPGNLQPTKEVLINKAT